MTDLWPPDLGDVTTSKSPVTILKEQASLLGSKTKNIAKAQIKRLLFDNLARFVAVDARKRPLQPEPFNYGFYLQAPALDNYTYHLFTLCFGVDYYPASFVMDDEIAKEINASPTKGVAAGSEEEFVQVLAAVLGSQKTRKVIRAILSQSVDAGSADDSNYL